MLTSGLLRILVFNWEIWLRRTTAWLRDLPDFVIVGVQRGGTTSLYQYLMQHPCVAAARKKEIHYFSLFYYRGQAWYRAYFPMRGHKDRLRRRYETDIITGEASPYYMFHPAAASRLAQTIPQAKLIAILRNPIDRAYSHYLHNLKHPEIGEKLSFKAAIAAEAERLAGEYERLSSDIHYPGHNYRHYSYLSRGIYVDQLQRLASYFPTEQMLILSSEVFFANTANSFSQVLHFLGLPDWAPAEYLAHNAGQKGIELNPETRKYLFEYFQPHNQRLFDYLNRDLGWA